MMNNSIMDGASTIRSSGDSSSITKHRLCIARGPGMRVFAGIVRTGIGCALIWSSLPKIRHPYDFLGRVYEYELVGANFGVFIAMTLPWLELLIAWCLISGLFVGGALLGSSILLAVFTAVQASVLWRGLSIACVCLSASGENLVNYRTLIQTGLLSTAAVLGLVCVLYRPPRPGDAAAVPPSSA